MIRILTLVGLMIVTIVVQAQETNNMIEIKMLMSVPKKRHAALILNTITENDSTAAISIKRENYYNALKQIAQEIRNQYYFHDEYPTNVFGGIEDRADVLVAAKYPLSNVTGASYTDYLQDSYRIEMAEETVSFMARAIFNRLKDGDVKIADKPIPAFESWNINWKAAGKIPNGPNQNLAKIAEK